MGFHTGEIVKNHRDETLIIIGTDGDGYHVRYLSNPHGVNSLSWMVEAEDIRPLTEAEYAALPQWPQGGAGNVVPPLFPDAGEDPTERKSRMDAIARSRADGVASKGRRL